MDGLTWEVFDIMGTVAFAVSGAVVGIEKRMDIFGIIVLALLTTVGGGIVRDVLAGITPPTALCHVTDFMLSIVTAVIVSTVYALLPLSRKRRHRILQVYNFCDTVGLASFTVTGMLTGLASGTARIHTCSPCSWASSRPWAAASCATSWRSACQRCSTRTFMRPPRSWAHSSRASFPPPLV